MNNKAIQILRSLKNRIDDSIKDEELLDGQLFYSKDDKQLHIGDNQNYSSMKVGRTLPIGAANLVPGKGANSIESLGSVGGSTTTLPFVGIKVSYTNSVLLGTKLTSGCND
jgi:hypothetical protein